MKRYARSPDLVGADRKDRLKAGGSIQPWSNFTYPDRLNDTFYGYNYNLNTGMSLAGAQADMTDSQMHNMKTASGINAVRYMWYYEEATVSRTDPTLTSNAIATLQYVIPRLISYGIRVIICPNSSGQARQDIHGQNGSVGTLTTAGWLQYIHNIWNAVKNMPGVDASNVWIGTGNEMGLNVSDPYRSMVWYNAYLVSAVADIRSYAPDVTIEYDLYPTAALDHYTFGGTELVRPVDQNTVASIHEYWPNMFTEEQGNNDTSPTGMRYVFGIKYNWDRATIQAYLNTWTCGGLYGTGSSDGILATAQIDWWRANLNSVLYPEGTTKQTIVNRLAPVLAWANDHQIALVCGEFGMGAALSSHWTMPDDDRAGFMGDVTSIMQSHGIPHRFWQYIDLTTGVAGSRVLDPVKLGWFNGKVPPTTGDPNLN